MTRTATHTDPRPPSSTRSGMRGVSRSVSRPVLTAAVLLAATAGGVLPALAAPASTSAATVRVHPGVTCGYSAPVVQPTFVPVSCGDGSAFVIHVRWTYLSVTIGRAKGIFLLDDCVPNCAYGHYRAYGARLSFSRVRTMAGHPYFSRLHIAFTSRRPSGVQSESASYGPLSD
jgi:hypothetical protein